MKFYPTRRSLDSAIEAIEKTDPLLGGNVRVTESHKVFAPILVPVLIGAAICVAAAVCLAVFVHPAAGIAAAVISALIAKRLRDKRLHLQRIIVYDRAIERHTTIELILSDRLKGRSKEKYEASLGDEDPEVRKAMLEAADDELRDIYQRLATDINDV